MATPSRGFSSTLEQHRSAKSQNPVRRLIVDPHPCRDTKRLKAGMARHLGVSKPDAIPTCVTSHIKTYMTQHSASKWVIIHCLRTVGVK